MTMEETMQSILKSEGILPVGYARPQGRVARRFVREVGSTRSSADWPELADGQGTPVLLVPGFLANDATMGRLGRWLSQSGYQVQQAGIGLNTACAQQLVDRLAAVLERQDGGRAVVIGQSRGGMLARGLAVSRPDLVSAAVMLGSPVHEPIAIAGFDRYFVAGVSVLGTLAYPD